MRKSALILLSLIFCFNTAAVQAKQDKIFKIEEQAPAQKTLMQVGFRILNANRIDKRMTFYFVESPKIITKNRANVKRIDLYRGLSSFMDSEEEMAAVLSHQIAHQLDFHKGLYRRTANALHPRKTERETDKDAVDLMVRAGYNPLALIVVLNKTAPETSWFERSARHTNGSKRLVSIYEYIFRNYPYYIAENEYQKNIYYQNFLIISKTQRAKLKEKYEAEKIKNINSTEKVEEK